MYVVNRLSRRVFVSVDEAVRLIRRADYVHWYDTLPLGSPNEISLLELAFPAYLDAVPNFKNTLRGLGPERLESALGVASSALAAIPTRTSLTNWDDCSRHRELLHHLFVTCTGGEHGGLPYFGPARCTKLLHKKRPELIPIIDRWQLQGHGMRRSGWSAEEMVETAFLIRAEMLQQVDEIRAIRTTLMDGRSGVPHLSDVRLYDIVTYEVNRET